MSDALLLLPDFALIVLGWLICRHTPLNRPVWDGAERLVYYVLFPALLFNAILRYPLAPGSALPPAGVSETYPDYTSWTTVADLAKKQYHWKTFGNQNIRMVDLAQALKAAGDKKVTVEMGPQDRDTFTPSTAVEVK